MGGGSSKSAVEIKNNTLVMNQSQIDIMNQNIISATANTLVKNASTCTASQNLSQNIDLRNLNVAGDFDIGQVQQNMSAMMTFSCVQTSDVRTEIMNNIMNQLTTFLNSIQDQNIVDKINANADSNQQSGFLSSSGSSSSDANVTNNYTSLTKYNKSVTNILNHSVTSNLTVDTINNCISNVNASQNFAVSGNFGRNFTIKLFTQDMAIKSISDCLQTSNISDKITSTITSGTGITVIDDTKLTKSTDLTATAESVQKSLGPITELGNAISGVLNNLFGGLFGGLLSGLFTGVMASLTPLILCILCMCCCTFAVIGLPIGFGGSGNKGKSFKFDDDQFGGTIVKLITDS